MMKRIEAILLSIVMLFTGCAQPDVVVESASPVPEETVQPAAPLVWHETVPQYDAMSDQGLHSYIEDVVYSETVAALDSEEYFVEDVQTVYMSKEYLEEVAFNSQKNVYFGYTLDELDQVFQGKKYIFTLGENGETVVEELDEIQDNTAGEILQNVMVGSGVILVCVTVSTVTKPTAPAISVIFAASAKAAKDVALSSALFGGVAAGVSRGLEKKDFAEAVEAAVMSASEGFKWGAIGGAVSGGVSEGKLLYHNAKTTAFTMNQLAKIQKETGYPLDVIKQFHNMDEYQAFKDANLKTAIVNKKTALIKTDIDLNRVDDEGMTNLQRMRKGRAPLDADGISYELHHVGQKKDGTLAVLTRKEHDNDALHGFLKRSEAHTKENNWDAQREAFWRDFATKVG